MQRMLRKCHSLLPPASLFRRENRDPPYGQIIETVGNAGSIYPGVSSPRAVRYVFFWAINGGYRGLAGKGEQRSGRLVGQAHVGRNRALLPPPIRSPVLGSDLARVNPCRIQSDRHNHDFDLMTQT
jgi:hypothetical protein